MGKRKRASRAFIDAHREGVAAETYQSLLPTTAAHSLSVHQSFNAGATFQEIAESFQISRQRVHQILGRKPKAGILYVIRNPENRRYKIGVTANWESRFQTLKSELGIDPELIAQYDSDDIFRDEIKVHQALGDRNIQGEWFDLKTLDFRFIYWFFELNRHL